MHFLTNKKVVLFVTSTIVVEIGYRLYKKIQNDKKTSKTVNCNVILFFSGSYANDWRNHSRHECEIAACYCHNFTKIIRTLNTARKTLDICFYLITSQDITRTIIELHKRGVRVRVITDFEMSHSSGSQINNFTRQGIEVRAKKLNCLMHHKFCLIDADQPEGLVITGSLNLTMQALAGNWDNLMLTNQPTMVKMFRDEFNRIWNSLS